MQALRSCLVGAACLAAIGCGSKVDGAPGTATPVGPGSGAYDDLGLDGVTLDDGQAAAILLAANDAIVHEGNVGASRGQSGDVQGFAQQTVTDATNASDAESAVLAGAGIALEECPSSTRLLNADVLTLAMLQSAPAADFDRAFVDARIGATTTLLDAVDRAILPSAKSADFLAYARGVRGMLAGHLAGLATLRSRLTHPSP